MSKLPENTRTTARGGFPRVVGPDTVLPRVLDFFELDGYSDPSVAWPAFTRTWNWAAPLAAAVPAEGPDGTGPVARPGPDGFTLSGQWRLPPGAGSGRWLVLPVAGARRRGPGSGADAVADLFVVASDLLPRASRGRGAGRDTDGAGPAFRLDGVRVPGGFATHSAGTALDAGDAPFAWTAVAGLALGAVRRLTDALAGLAPDTDLPFAAAAADLAAVLRDERLSLAARVHGAPLAGRADGARAAEALAAQIRRASRTVHHVVTAAYEHALPLTVGAGRDHLVRLVEESAPILHQLRFAVELLPPGDPRSTTVRD